MFRALAWLCVASFVLSGCTGSSVGGAKLARGQAAYQTIPAPAEDRGVSSYRIGALDVIDVTVFQEPELSLKGVVVDAGGSIAFPLIGSVAAVGKTTNETSKNSHPMRDPRITPKLPAIADFAAANSTLLAAGRSPFRAPGAINK